MPRPARKPFKSQRQSVQPPKAPRLIEAPQSTVRIAEWTEVPPAKRPAKAKTAVAAKAEAARSEAAKDAKGKRSARKPAAKAAAPVAKPTAKKPVRRTKKGGGVEDANISLGTDVDAPTESIGMAADEPKVRIAEVPTLTSSADKHLASDEPVDPETLRVVKSRRDLDHVPDAIE